jgi:lysophospholipase L1-like esterase
MPDKFTIVCFGDSFIEGQGDEARKGGWVGRLQEMLPSNNIPYQCRVLNLGIGGDTIRDLQYRLGEVLLRKPNLVILGCGINDIGLAINPVHKEGIEEPRISRYVADKSWLYVLDILQKSVPNILVMENTYVIEEKEPAGLYILNNDIKNWNVFISDECMKRNISFLKIAGLNSNIHNSDSVHLNAAGYSIYAAQVYNFIKNQNWLPKELQEEMKEAI